MRHGISGSDLFFVGGDNITSKIIRGVCENLEKEFTDVPIYTERVSQGLDEPCIFVYLRTSSLNLFRDKRYYMKNEICVEYFAPQQVENSSCGTALERICFALEKISCDKELRGSDIKCEIKDGVLSVTCSYNLFVYKQEQENTELMAGLKLRFEE